LSRAAPPARDVAVDVDTVQLMAPKGWCSGLTDDQRAACYRIMWPTGRGGRARGNDNVKVSDWWIRRTPSVRNPPTSLWLFRRDRAGRVTRYHRIT
jgi:hypothetical protein